jgi:hypothetical protein
MPRQLHAQLVGAATREGVSLNQYVVYLLTLQFASQQATVDPAWHGSSNAILSKPEKPRRKVRAI